MKKLEGYEKAMLKDMLKNANINISEIIKDGKSLDNQVTLEHISTVIILRLRKFIRQMDEKEVYELTKQISVLKSMRAADRHLLVKIISKFLKTI